MKIKVVSPTKSVFENDDVLEVYVSTTTGIIGILNNHANLLSKLDLGVLRIKFNNGTDEKKIVINGGMLQVSDNLVSILADDAALAENLVREEIAKAIENAENKIASSKLEPSELIQLEKQLRYERFKNEISS